MPGKADRPIVEDMLSYAEEAIGFLGHLTGAELAADRLRFLATVRALEIVGEAANQISPEGRALIAYDLRPAIAMRNRVIHGYGSVSADIVAKTVTDEFPASIAALRTALLGRLPGD